MYALWYMCMSMTLCYSYILTSDNFCPFPFLSIPLSFSPFPSLSPSLSPLLSPLQAGKDFYEGVRAVIVDKDNKPRWDPPTLEAVTEEIVLRHFAPVPGRELEL